MIAQLLNYDPYREFNAINRRLFGQFEPRRTNAVHVPIDIREESEHFVVEADVPGLGPDDLEIVATPERVTIKGSRKTATDTPALRRERTEYSFERSLLLPRGIDLGGIEAKLDAGVLTLRLPKRAEDRPRTITVKAVAATAPELDKPNAA